MPTLKYPKVVTIETEARRCPFCDSEDIFLNKEIIDAHNRYYVMCTCCKAKGPIAAIPYVAIKKWDGIGIAYGLSRTGYNKQKDLSRTHNNEYGYEHILP